MSTAAPGVISAEMVHDADTCPVLVVVVNNPTDLERVRDQGWYRIPQNRAPHRVAAEFLAFYLTAAFPPGERWMVRWLAPVHGYHLVKRRDLIPEEASHPRADALYYRIDLGELQALPHPVASRRLRRITFVNTTLARLLAAEDIHQLWIQDTSQQRLWRALDQIGAEDE